MRRFDLAPLDTLGRALSAVVVVALGGAGISLLVARSAWTTVGGVVILLGLGLTYALAPDGVELDGRQLSVRRKAWRPFEARVEGLAEVDEPGRLGLRVLGSGGGFGYWGRFRRGDIGTYRAYLTTRDRAHLVPLRTDHGVVIISPADAEGFVAAVTAVSR